MTLAMPFHSDSEQRVLCYCVTRRGSIQCIRCFHSLCTACVLLTNVQFVANSPHTRAMPKSTCRRMQCHLLSFTIHYVTHLDLDSFLRAVALPRVLLPLVGAKWRNSENDGTRDFTYTNPMPDIWNGCFDELSSSISFACSALHRTRSCVA